MPDRVTLCPNCKEQIEPGAAQCAACEYALTDPGGQRTVATRRDLYGKMPQPEDKMRQPEDFPGVGPGRACEGCDGSVIEVVGGEAVAYSLVSCDATYCYYESTPGGVA